jgi:hypothetical protein
MATATSGGPSSGVDTSRPVRLPVLVAFRSRAFSSPDCWSYFGDCVWHRLFTWDASLLSKVSVPFWDSIFSSVRWRPRLGPSLLFRRASRDIWTSSWYELVAALSADFGMACCFTRTRHRALVPFQPRPRVVILPPNKSLEPTAAPLSGLGVLRSKTLAGWLGQLLTCAGAHSNARLPFRAAVPPAVAQLLSVRHHRMKLLRIVLLIACGLAVGLSSGEKLTGMGKPFRLGP